MTVEAANRIVMSLIGEDDFHEDVSSLMSYYNIAQRQIATTVCPIIRSCQLSGTVNPLPPDLYRIKSVNTTYTRDGDLIITYGKETFTLTYYAYPSDVTDVTHEFVIDPEAQSALPFYAAAQAVLADCDMRRFNSFMDGYNNILANIAAAAKHRVIRAVVL